MILLMVLGAADPTVAACLDDDAAACRTLGKRALDEASDDDLFVARAEALLHFRHACDLGDGGACEDAAELLKDRNPDEAMLLRDRGQRLGLHPLQPVAPKLAEPPAERVATIESDELPERTGGSGSRFGVVAYAAGGGGNAGPSLSAGMGLRVGLRERNSDDLMFMPAMALVAGAVWNPDGVSPWVEQRFELMAARYGGALQPMVHGWVSTGLQFRSWTTASSPLGGYSGVPFARPYLGIGTGWNWLPQGGGGGGGGGGSWGSLGGGWGGLGAGVAGLIVVAVAVLAVVTFIFAGRVEFRLMPGLRQNEPVECALLIGAGF